jgi:hypothetical protein
LRGWLNAGAGSQRTNKNGFTAAVFPAEILAKYFPVGILPPRDEALGQTTRASGPSMIGEILSTILPLMS